MTDDRLPGARKDAITFVAQALQRVPQDPAKASAGDLAQLQAIAAALAAEAVQVAEALAGIAHQVEGARGDALTLGELIDLGYQQEQLESRHGRLEIASARLDNFTAAAFQANGITIADSGD